MQAVNIYKLIQGYDLDTVYSVARARACVRPLEDHEPVGHDDPTEAPKSDTMPISYAAPTSRPMRAA